MNFQEAYIEACRRREVSQEEIKDRLLHANKHIPTQAINIIIPDGKEEALITLFMEAEGMSKSCIALRLRDILMAEPNLD